MVTPPPIPPVCWPEAADAAAEQRTAARICELLTEGLPPLAAGDARLLFVVPTPAPYDAAHGAVMAAWPAGMRVRSLAWPPHGRCYVAGEPAAWPAVAAEMFRLGPPELTFVAVQGPCGIDSAAPVLLRMLQAMLADRADADVRAHRGLHFDSGALSERF